MKKTSFHCAIMALIFTVPTVFLGVTDWQHFYASTWSHPIQIKVALTVVFFALLIAGVIMGARKKTGYSLLILIYLLCSITVGALGFYGAQLVYADRGSAGTASQQGEKLYAANCGGCHPNGGNTINPKLPVLNSPQLKDVNTFMNFNRNPVLPDGSRGTMPAFPKDRLSDDELKQIYKYVTEVLGKQGGK